MACSCVLLLFYFIYTSFTFSQLKLSLFCWFHVSCFIPLQYGLSAGSIGVVSSHRHQETCIREKLIGHCRGDDLSNVEVSTVDKYQGRDKACVIASFVRSNPEGNVSVE